MQKIIISRLALAAASFPRAEAADKAEDPATAGETKRVRWASAPPVKQNTYRLRRMQEESKVYFEKHPLRNRYGQAIGAHNWTFPPPQAVEAKACTAQP